MYEIPESIHHELKNWTAWSWQGEVPHPTLPSQSNFAKYFVATESNAYDVVTDDDGTIHTVNTNDAVERPIIDNGAAQRVDVAWHKYCNMPNTEAARKVLLAEYFGFGQYTLSKRPIPRHNAAQRLRISLEAYELLLQRAVTTMQGLL